MITAHFIKPIVDIPYRLYIEWFARVILYLLPYVTNMAHDNVVIGVGS